MGMTPLRMTLLHPPPSSFARSSMGHSPGIYRRMWGLERAFLLAACPHLCCLAQA